MQTPIRHISTSLPAIRANDQAVRDREADRRACIIIELTITIKISATAANAASIDGRIDLRMPRSDF